MKFCLLTLFMLCSCICLHVTIGDAGLGLSLHILIQSDTVGHNPVQCFVHLR